MTDEHEEYSMVTIILQCPHCGSEALVRDGHATGGKQKYRCHGCGRRSREHPTPNAYPEAHREELLHVYQERSSLRGLTCTDCASLGPPCPVGAKKGAQLPPLCTTLLAPDPEDPTPTTLELDELWSFVLKQAHDSWMWIALCRKTRQVVAYAVGDRSRQEVVLQKILLHQNGRCVTRFFQKNMQKQYCFCMLMLSLQQLRAPFSFPKIFCNTT